MNTDFWQPGKRQVAGAGDDVGTDGALVGWRGVEGDEVEMERDG